MKKKQITGNGKSVKPKIFDNILQKKVPFYFILLLLLAAVAATVFITQFYFTEMEQKDESASSNTSEYNIKRLKGYKFIQPLLSAKPVEESVEYNGIKQNVLELIQKYKDEGIITSASVYMRDFDKSNWFNANGLEQYTPGSVLKIAVLMCYLRIEEEHPGALEKTLVYSTKLQTNLMPLILKKSIELGKSYTVRQLLEYMIVYSDNAANSLLNQNLENEIFFRIFSDLGLKMPTPQGYQLTARECSRFMEALFNATYLNNKNSEYAMDLLTRTSYADGIVKGIPEPGITIAHKFGESGDTINRQLHETAIFYIKEKPYLITIMTRGASNIDLTKLSGVVQNIANLIYKHLVEKT